MRFNRSEPIIEGIPVQQSMSAERGVVPSKEKTNLENVTAYSDSQDNFTAVSSSNDLSGFAKLAKKLEIEKGDGQESAVVNVDLLPVPAEERTWTSVTCEHSYSILKISANLVQTGCSGSANAPV
jgi:hypothetical protein